MNIASLIIGLVVGIALVVFGAQNAQSINVHFFAWESSSVPLVFALGASMLVGAILTLLVSIPGRIRGRGVRRALERELAERDRMVPAMAPRMSPPPMPVEPPIEARVESPIEASVEREDEP